MKHLQIALETLIQHQLYAKQAKCHFGCIEIAYLANLISIQGIRINPNKLQAIKE